MTNPRLSARYAKSLIDLASELNQLDRVQEDVQLLQALCQQSRPFMLLLRSPIIDADRKVKAIDAVTKDKLGDLMSRFVKLLVRKRREMALPDILEAFGEQFRVIKGIVRINLTTAVPVSDEIKAEIVKRLTEFSNLKVELVSKVDPKIIGGFVLENKGNLIDGSILRDLLDVRRQFMRNDYLFQIR
jgi:F-type H+-transporting ATPase subunit delta